MPDETIEDWLKEQIEYADAGMRESHQLSQNSYGAGYDRGFYDGLKAAEDKLRELWGTKS